MQIIELAGVIFALSMEILVGVIFVQLLKAIKKNGLARLSWVFSSYEVILPYKAYVFRNVSSHIKG